MRDLQLAGTWCRPLYPFCWSVTSGGDRGSPRMGACLWNIGGPGGFLQGFRSRQTVCPRLASRPPASMNAAMSSISEPIDRSVSNGGMNALIASQMRSATGPGRWGLRYSRPWAAQISSMASTRAVLSRTWDSFLPAPQPIETWSSWEPEVGIDSTEAGWARTRFSATRAAAVYWAIM